MKYIFIAIGLVLIAGGIKAVTHPSSPVVTMGGNRYNPTMSYHAMPSQGSRYMGYTSIGLGAAAIAVGASAKFLFGVRVRPKTKKK